MKIACALITFSILLISSWGGQAAAQDEYPIYEPTQSTTSVSYQSAVGMELADALKRKDKAEAARLLEENGKELANTKYRSRGCFHYDEGGVIFLTLRNPEMLELLLDHGAEIESRNRNDETPLLAAAFAALPDTVALLINRGANPNAIRTIKAMRMCEGSGKTQVCKDMPEQELTALDVVRLNLEGYEKHDGLTNREEKIRDYKQIIGMLEPVTLTKKSQD